MDPDHALRKVQRRSKAAGLSGAICRHTFRATGTTAYLENGGTIENAQVSPFTNRPRQQSSTLYDRTAGQITLDEVERTAT